MNKMALIDYFHTSNRIKRLVLLERLVALRTTRKTIIGLLPGISQKDRLNTYREKHGKIGRKGRTIETVESLAKPKIAIHVALFLSYCVFLRRSGVDRAEAFVSSYETYKSHIKAMNVSEQVITPETAYFAMNQFTSGMICLLPCNSCHVPTLMVTSVFITTVVCPECIRQKKLQARLLRQKKGPKEGPSI